MDCSVSQVPGGSFNLIKSIYVKVCLLHTHHTDILIITQEQNLFDIRGDALSTIQCRDESLPIGCIGFLQFAPHCLRSAVFLSLIHI